MKTLNSIIATVALAALTLSQMPEPANCQMALRGPIAMSCAMPCCGKSQVPSCPMIKAEAPRDIIVAKNLLFDTALQPLNYIRVAIRIDVRTYVRYITDTTSLIKQFFIGPPPPARAPPAYVHLLNA